jgi:hypothetical protein
MFLLDWILGLFKTDKPGEVVEVVEPTPAPKPKAKKPKAKPAPKKEAKVTKASLKKLTKAQLEEEGRKVGLVLDKRKLKDELVDLLFAQLK